MHEYCVEELHLSEDAASKRLHVARKVRNFPALLTALADGRIHLTGARLLAPHLSPANVDDLLEAATHKTKAEIERLVAGRFPQPDLPTTVRAIPVQSPTNFEHAPGHAEVAAVAWANPNASEPVRAPFPKLKPLAPERFALQVAIGQDTPTTCCGRRRSC